MSGHGQNRLAHDGTATRRELLTFTGRPVQ